MQVTDEMVAAAMRAFRIQPADLNVPDPVGMYIDHRRMRDAVQAALDAMPKATGGLIPGPAHGDSVLARIGDASCSFTLPPDMTRGALPPTATVSINLGAADDKTIIETLSRVLGSLAERKVGSALDILGGQPLVEVNLGGDMIPDRDGVRRIVRTKPRGEAGEPTPLGDANPYGPLPPMVIPADHPLLDTNSFNDLSTPASVAAPRLDGPDTAAGPIKLADYLISAEIDAHIDIAEEDSVRDDWWRASCLLHDWYTTGSKHNVEIAAAEHVENEHRPCAVFNPHITTDGPVYCYLLPGHDGDHMGRGGSAWRAEGTTAVAVQHVVPVAEPRPLARQSELHLYLGIGEVAMARMIRFRDDYRPQTPLPVHEATADSEALYDPEEVKAWYDALPQAADG